MGKYIESRDNRIIKECVRLTRKKYRDKEDRDLIEGENLIGEALSEGIDISALLMRDGTTFEVPDRVDTYIIEPGLFDSIAQTETSQGILAIVARNSYTVEELEKANEPGINYIVLDRLQDPGNIGTIIRTAEGAGYGAVITVKGTADVYSPKVVRAAAGSVFRIPIVSVEDGRELRETVDRL
ncbi:MAG: RNA methyltransferase, partial [Clostridiales bacterium]|nr:RNA methyltransferase [Clostridiales bacterium]